MCEEDADCGEALECIKSAYIDGCTGSDPGASGGSDAKDGEQPEDCGTTEPVVSRYGYCQLAEVPCDSDDECLDGLSCVELDVSSGAGEDAVSLEKAAGKVCAYEPTRCTEDGDCEDNYECIKEEACEDIAPDCDGEECPAVEPECIVAEEGFCAPKPIPCDTDSECEDDWKCVDNGVVDSDAPVSSDEGGDAISKDASKVCLPEGLAVIAESRGLAYATDGAGADKGSNSGGEEADSDDDSAGGSGGSSGMCAVRAGGSGSAGSLWLLAGLLGLAAARRRRAA